MLEAYEAKKWAFVSDYARLKVLYENGEFFIGTPAQEVYAKANEIINRMK